MKIVLFSAWRVEIQRHFGNQSQNRNLIFVIPCARKKVAQRRNNHNRYKTFIFDAFRALFDFDIDSTLRVQLIRSFQTYCEIIVQHGS